MTEEFDVLNHDQEQQKTQPNSYACIDENTFSWDKLLERFGDEEMAIEVVSIFLNDNTERFEQLTIAVEASDIKQVKFYAHALRGAGGNIGSKALWDIGSKMEHAAVEGNIDLIKSCYNELKPVFEKLVEFFSRPDWLELAKPIKSSN
jgi:HPt (histidine-containing phosphotransfer) domain-containing protein